MGDHMSSSGEVVSGWIEFRCDDESIIREILGEWLTGAVEKAEFAGYRVARFEALPDEVLRERLQPFWGQFEWILDAETRSY